MERVRARTGGAGSLRPLLLTVFALLLALSPANAGNPQSGASLDGKVVDAAQRLKPGEYLWIPEIAPAGPLLLIVNVATQRAILYRNGIPIGISTVSTGSPGRETPTGVFTILQKRVEHYSNLYGDAPMPYMQRLTWGGVALHAGNLPGYPASHGCIRLPLEFARRLYGETKLGMTVIVSADAAAPRVAPTDPLLAPRGTRTQPMLEWAPHRSPDGPVSIVVSAADARAVIIRNGIVIGTTAVNFDGPLRRTQAFVLRKADAPRSWLRIVLPGEKADEAAEPLRGRIQLPEPARELVEGVLAEGTTVVVTPDSLVSGSTGQVLRVIDTE